MVHESLVTHLRGGLERVPERTWLRTPRGSLTREGAWDGATRMATGLADAGLRPGDRLALFCRNGTEFVQAWLAAQLLGVGVVPVNTGFREVEAGYVMRHAGVKGVLADADTLPVVGAALPDLPAVSLVVGLEPSDHLPGVRTASVSDLLSAPPLPGEHHAQPSPDDIASVLYTSGTTGPPKGCLLGHDYFTIGARAVVDQLRLTADDVMMCVLPLFHMNAQVSSVTASLLCDATLVLEDRFSASGFWPVAREHGVTEFSYLGVISAALAKAPATAADRDHRIRVGFGAGMPAALHAEFEARFGIAMLEVFGMTETGMDLATQLVEDRRVGRRSMGTVVPGKAVRIVDDAGREVAPGATGHLQVRGPGLFRGYLDDEEATRASYDGSWFRTGDLARRDEDGWYYYVDRFKDIIRRAGENIGSVEVETVLTGHEAIAAAAVIGIDDDVVGQEVKALVVLQPGQVATPALYEDVLRHCENHLASFKVPRWIEALDEMPRTPSQKIVKATLRREHDDTGSAHERTWRPGSRV